MSRAQAVALVVVGDTAADAQRQLTSWGLASIGGVAVDGAASGAVRMEAGVARGSWAEAGPVVRDTLAAADALLVFVSEGASEVRPALDLLRGVTEREGQLLVAVTLPGGERHLGSLRHAADLVVRGRDASLLQEVAFSLLQPDGPAGTLSGRR
jgi:hypothetical protein